MSAIRRSVDWNLAGGYWICRQKRTFAWNKAGPRKTIYRCRSHRGISGIWPGSWYCHAPPITQTSSLLNCFWRRVYPTSTSQSTVSVDREAHVRVIHGGLSKSMRCRSVMVALPPVEREPWCSGQHHRPSHIWRFVCHSWQPCFKVRSMQLCFFSVNSYRLWKSLWPKGLFSS